MRTSPLLRRHARLETPTEIPDGSGGMIPGWLPVADYWIALMPVSGQEAWEGARETATITHRILLRCPRTLRPRPDQRFVIQTRTFAIRAVFDRDGRGRFLTCLTEEGRNEP